MNLVHTAASLLVSLSLVTASCVQSPGRTTEADDDVATTTEAATTSCGDVCFAIYLAACALCKKQGLGRACYAEAMEEYVRCARRCREEGSD
jgi:hypothetical protein